MPQLIKCRCESSLLRITTHQSPWPNFTAVQHTLLRRSFSFRAYIAYAAMLLVATNLEYRALTTDSKTWACAMRRSARISERSATARSTRKRVHLLTTQLERMDGFFCALERALANEEWASNARRQMHYLLADRRTVAPSSECA